MDKTINLYKDDILFREHDTNADLYYLLEGELMICVTQQSRVTVLAYIKPGEFIGEMSFFDSSPRSANVVATQSSTLLHIPHEELSGLLPSWFIRMATSLTEQIRLSDSVIQKKGIKRKMENEIRPLSVEEQSHYFKLLKK